MYSVIKHPSAFLPIALSLVACVLVITQVAFFGATHQTDEGTAAHIWQLLMAIQVPLVLFFAIKYIPHQTKQASQILGLQVLAIIAAMLPVLLFHL